MSDNFEKIYRDVPLEQKVELSRFRVTHVPKEIIFNDKIWQYWSSGSGDESILLLTGGMRYGEAWYRHIVSLECDYRIISPSYGPSPTMEGTIDAIVAMLELEGIQRVHTVGQSLGGLVAQCLVRKYPEKIDSMIISNTTAPAKDLDQKLREEKAKRIRKLLRLMSIVPYPILRVVLKRKLSKMLSIVEEREQFWKAYTKELIEFNTTKQDLINTYSIMMDLIKNYFFSREDVAEWTGKVLLIGSDHDPAFDPSEWEALKRLYPHAEIYTFEGTGHLGVLSRHEDYINLVRNFLQGQHTP